MADPARKRSASPALRRSKDREAVATEAVAELRAADGCVHKEERKAERGRRERVDGEREREREIKEDSCRERKGGERKMRENMNILYF